MFELMPSIMVWMRQPRKNLPPHIPQGFERFVSSAAENRSILVVDDDRGAMEALSDILE
jgi:hypothetical protein